MRKTAGKTKNAEAKKYAPPLTRKEEQAAFLLALQAHNPWEEAKKIPVVRADYIKPTEIDPGVNFFVLALNSLGIQTQYSCEGHPAGFYITFFATEKQARKIQRTGFFRVEIETGENYWSLRLSRPKTESAKRRTLTWAAEAWTKTLLHEKKTENSPL